MNTTAAQRGLAATSLDDFMQMPRTAAGPRLAAIWARWSRLVATAARRHWLLTLLLVAGLVLRIITQITYRPALFYIDTIKYLYGAYPGNDPPGYELFLKVFLPVANLDLVAAPVHAALLTGADVDACR